MSYTLFDPIKITKTIHVSAHPLKEKNLFQEAADKNVDARIKDWLKTKFDEKMATYIYNLWTTQEPSPVILRTAIYRPKMHSMLLTKKTKEELYANIPIVINKKDKQYSLFFLRPAIFESQGKLKITFYPETIKIGNLFEQKWLQTYRKKALTKDGDYLLRDHKYAIDIINPSSTKKTTERPKPTWYDSPRGKHSIYEIIPEFTKPTPKKIVNSLSKDEISLSPVLTKQTTKSNSEDNWFQKVINYIVEIVYKVFAYFKTLWISMFPTSDPTIPKVISKGPQQDLNLDKTIENHNDKPKVIICKEEEATSDDDDLLNFFNNQ